MNCPHCFANLYNDGSVKCEIRGIGFYSVKEGGKLSEDAVAVKKRGSLKCRECGHRLNKTVTRNWLFSAREG